MSQHTLPKFKARLSKIEHRNEDRIKIEISFEKEAIRLVKKMTGRRWSQSKTCWHLPYSQASFEEAKNVFHLSFNETDFEFKSEKNISQSTDNQPNKEKIQILPENDFRIKAIVPRHRKEWIKKIKTITGRAWNMNEKYWSLPKTEQTFSDLQKLFGDHLTFDKSVRIPEPSTEKLPSSPHFEKVISKPNPEKGSAFLNKNFQKINQDGKEYSVFFGEKIRIERLNSKWLKIFVPYDKKGWIETVRNMPGRKWNSEDKFWEMPNVKNSYRILKKFVGMKNLEFDFEISADIPEKFESPKPKPPGRNHNELNEKQQKAITAFEQTLLLENKRWRTIKTYQNQLVALFRFYPQSLPSKITADQLKNFMATQIKQKNISRSRRNQIINAFNAFYGRTLRQSEKLQGLIRPKKEKKLPNVVSPQEIKRLLNAVDNIKHKTMLMLIYSAGLRKGELLNLKVRDLNFERQAIFVKNGKGGKDRYTFLSSTATKYVKTYLKAYHPKHWLFEGQYGAQYSETSLQSIFSRARARSFINPDLTIHGLRHSFATHLVENGVPLHQVKELLGHVHLDTTAVYLHVANKFRDKIESPLENLNL